MDNAFSLGAAGISALGSVLGGIASNSMSLGQMKDMADYQAAINYKYAKKSALKMPTYNRQGLENANFNPMLAISNGLSNANSSWSSGGSPTSADMSGAVNNALDKALSVRQQDNQNKLTESQVGLNNANSVLSQNRALTETYTQLEKMAHTDLMESEKILADRNASYREKEIAWYDKKVSTEIMRMNVQNKVDIMNAFSGRVQANAAVIGANANAKDVSNRYNLGVQQLNWDKKKWSIGSTIAGIGSLAIPGASYLKGAKTSSQIFKALHFMK